MDPKLKKLQAKWYKRLKREGFVDIEDVNSEREMLKEWHSLYFLSRYDVQRFEAKKRYFELATQFLESHVFDTSREKAIWAQYAAGESVRTIAKSRRTSEFKINKVIKPLEDLMLGRS